MFLNVFVTIFALIGWRLQGEIKKKLLKAVLYLHNTQPLLSEDRRLICSIRGFSLASIFADFSVSVVGGCVDRQKSSGAHFSQHTEKSAKF